MSQVACLATRTCGNSYSFLFFRLFEKEGDKYLIYSYVLVDKSKKKAKSTFAIRFIM